MALKPAPDAQPITGLELVRDIIAEAGLGQPHVDLFMAKDPGTVQAGIVTLVQESDDIPHLTMGTAVAVESQQVNVIVYGDPEDYGTPRARAMRLRYLIAAQSDYVSRGVRMLAAIPLGNALPLGRDQRERELFSINFTVTWEPLYV